MSCSGTFVCETTTDGRPPVSCCIQVTRSAWFILKKSSRNTARMREWEKNLPPCLAFDRWWLTGCCSRARNQTFSSACCVCVCVCGEIGLQISNEHTANMKGLSICFHLHCLSNSIHHTTCLLVFLSENTRTGIAYVCVQFSHSFICNPELLANSLCLSVHAFFAW